MAAESKSPFKWDQRENSRITILPVLHKDLWDFRKLTERQRWTVEDVDTSKDRADWMRMTEPVRQAARYNLGMFAVGDSPVLENCMRNFSRVVDCMEAKSYYAGQADGEAVHMEAYMLQIEAISENDDERKRIIGDGQFKTMPAIRAIVEWIGRWLNRSDEETGKNIGEILIAFGMFEGVIFSGSFCFIQWLRESNILSGVTKFNELIARDEGIHCQFACLLVERYLSTRPSQEAAEKIARGAYDVAAAMAVESLPEALSGGMSASLLKDYLQFQTNVVLKSMGYRPLFKVLENPCKWMDKMALNEVTKVNFFEARPTQYQGASASAPKYEIDETPIDF